MSKIHRIPLSLGHPYESFISWKEINDRYPWNVLFLAGGSFALAEGFKV